MYGAVRKGFLTALTLSFDSAQDDVGIVDCNDGTSSPVGQAYLGLDTVMSRRKSA